MKRFLYSPALLVIAVVCLVSSGVLSPSSASEEISQHATPLLRNSIEDNLVNPAACRHCRSSPCHCCEPVCCPKKVEEKEEKSCWKVASELVCVPGFRFPWEKCSGPVCGWVRCVNVLEEHKYECDTCGYEWEVKYVRSSTGKQHQHCRCPRCQRECR